MSDIQVYQSNAQSKETNATKIKRVAAYARVSTLQEEQEDSFETQREYYLRLINADPNMVLVEIYGDQGVSGLCKERRPAFMRMMKDCLAGSIDLVLTKSISRFARNLADCLDCIQTLKRHGIPVVFEKEGINSFDPGCDMMLSVLASLAQEEANSLSQNVRWSLERRNAAGRPNRAARYGYTKVKLDDGRTIWTINEAEAERVRLAFRMAAGGAKYKAIIMALNTMETNAGTGVRWTQNRIYTMLKSEVYIGDILTNQYFTPDYVNKKVKRNHGQRPQYYIEGHHEPIISKATFERVRDLITRTPASRGKEENHDGHSHGNEAFNRWGAGAKT